MEVSVLRPAEAPLAVEALRSNSLQKLVVGLDVLQEDEPTSWELWSALGSNTSLATLRVCTCSKPLFVARALEKRLTRFPAGFWEALRINTSLQELNLSERVCCTGSEGAVALAQGIRSNSSLRRLDLADSNVGPEGAEAVGKALWNSPSPEMMHHLFDRRIGFCCTAMLGEALRSRSALEILDLAGNEIGAKGAAALGEALRFNTSLEVLVLGNNRIGAEGALALGQGLQHNTSLQLLDLSANDIGTKGAAALGKALQTNASLQDLDLETNAIGTQGGVALAQALRRNRTLCTLDLSCNEIGTDGAITLVEALRINTSLRYLNLSFNNFCSTAALRALGQADDRVE